MMTEQDLADEVDDFFWLTDNLLRKHAVFQATGFTVDDAEVFMSAGISVDLAVRWRARGIDAETAARILSHTLNSDTSNVTER